MKAKSLVRSFFTRIFLQTVLRYLIFLLGRLEGWTNLIAYDLDTVKKDDFTD